MNTFIQKVIDLYESNTAWYSISIMILAIFILAKQLGREKRRKRLLASQIPGPDGIFLIGELPLFFKGPENIIKKGKILYQKYEKTLFKLWICHRLYIVLTQPEDIEAVLTNPKLQKKSIEYRVLQDSIMGQGLFSIEDVQQWKKNRKTVSGGFSFTILKSFISIFYEEANVLNEILQNKCDPKSKECEIHTPIGMATMEMIGRTSLGIKFNAQKGGRHPFIENLQTAMLAWEYRLTHPWYLNDILFWFSSVYRQHKKCQKFINEFTDHIINKKMNELNKNENLEIKTEVEDEVLGKKPKTAIEILIENYHEMSHKQIRDELVVIMIGGQETTAMTNACAIFMLAHNQDVQNKLFEELKSIFSNGDPNRQPTYEDLQQMEYLDRVIKETMRHFSPVPIFGRSLDEEMKIGEHLCPAGSSLMVVPLFLHKNSLYYNDPEKFDPDNFLPEKCRNRNPYAFVPFSAGYRNCLGIKYGMLQMKIIISTIVRENKILPSDRCPTPENLKLMFLMTLKFVNGCFVKLQPRT